MMSANDWMKMGHAWLFSPINEGPVTADILPQMAVLIRKIWEIGYNNNEKITLLQIKIIILASNEFTIRV